MLPGLRLGWRIGLAPPPLVVLWDRGSEDIQVRFRTTQQCSSHTQRDKIDKGALATAGVTEERQMWFRVEHRQCGEPLELPVRAHLVLSRCFRTLRHERGINRGQLQIPACLFANALGGSTPASDMARTCSITQVR